MASNSNTCKVAALALGEGMKILLIKDHVWYSINGFHERIRATTNASFSVA